MAPALTVASMAITARTAIATRRAQMVVCPTTTRPGRVLPTERVRWAASQAAQIQLVAAIAARGVSVAHRAGASRVAKGTLVTAAKSDVVFVQMIAIGAADVSVSVAMVRMGRRVNSGWRAVVSPCVTQLR